MEQKNRDSCAEFELKEGRPTQERENGLKGGEMNCSKEKRGPPFRAKTGSRVDVRGKKKKSSSTPQGENGLKGGDDSFFCGGSLYYPR